METLLSKMGELIAEAYIAGRITQQEQGGMIEIINHLSLEGFVKKQKPVKLEEGEEVKFLR